MLRTQSTHRPAQPRRTAGGFTLVELLVVIGIIAVLISILLPSLNKARESAKRVQCLSNIRQIAMAALAYAAENKGAVPRSSEVRPMLPYEWRVKTFVDPLNRYLGGSMEKLWVCPSTYEKKVDYYTGGGDPYYEVTYAWLAGLNEQENVVGPGVFLETPPNVSKRKLANQNSTKRLIADLNMYLFRTPLEGRSNHGSWGTGVSIQAWLAQIKGSNCVYADGHGEWVPLDGIGKGNKRPKSQLDARYTHSGTVTNPNRPYFW